MLRERYIRAFIALLVMGSAILLFSCKSKESKEEVSLNTIKTEESENLTIIMSENGRKSYHFKTPLLEGYTLGSDPYREFRKGISITTFQDDSMTTVNAVLVANYAIYYENRKLWEAKGDVVVTKHDGTRLYTQQLFWNSVTKRIYSNVDTRLVTETDELIGEGFESDEEMTEPRFRRWKGKMQVDTEELRNGDDGNDGNDGDNEPNATEERGSAGGNRKAESKDIVVKTSDSKKIGDSTNRGGTIRPNNKPALTTDTAATPATPSRIESRIEGPTPKITGPNKLEKSNISQPTTLDSKATLPSKSDKPHSLSSQGVEFKSMQSKQ